MKLTFKMAIIVFLAIGLSLHSIIIRGSPPSTNSIYSVKQVNNKTIPIALPSDAEVFLKNGDSLSGRLTNFDSTRQKITVTLSGQSKEFSVAEIDKVEFAGKFTLTHSGKIVVRGPKTPNSGKNQQTWTESFADFRIIDPQNGRTEITLNSVRKPKLKGVLEVAKNSSYVVDEITFDTSNQTINIKATPYAE